MAKKPKKEPVVDRLPENAHIAGAGLIETQPITNTLETNYMPYAMSVIMSRAIPEIDGFKPSHRKLLYTMYKMGLLTGTRTKSANIVGATMKLNPHGDAAIYETMVRLSRGNEALLHPYVDSKGNFGRAYSSDMEYAASRYTEAKLDPLAGELFRDIDKDTVDFVDNYDSTMKEPTLLPVAFPTILVNSNMGIAVGMASSICSFNLSEVCETTIRVIQQQEQGDGRPLSGDELLATLKAPDFSGGGEVVFDRDELCKIYETGRGSVKIRATYRYDKAAGCIDVTEIPYTTTIEAIVSKITDLVKSGKIREIRDVRNETGLSGLKITIDIKNGVDPDRLMTKLYAMTPLADNFSCNFNVLIAGVPRVLGVGELLQEWIAFRMECVRRRTYFDLHKAQDKLHLLKGLKKILLDIDKAVAIVRETEEESEVVPNLMIGFGIDEIQAEYVAEIKLRHLNREYILRRTAEMEQLMQDIAQMDDILKSASRVREILVEELRGIMEKYGQPRRSRIVYAADIEETVADSEEEVPDDPCYFFFTAEGYFKKISPASLRMASEQKLKEGDRLVLQLEASSNRELLFFTDAGNVYKAKADDFSYTKASVLGDFVASKLGFDPGEAAIGLIVTADYSGYVLFLFENGKAAKVELSAYATKTNRRKLVGAFSTKSPVVAIVPLVQDGEVLLTASSGRMLLLHSGAVAPKSTRSTQGVQVMTLRGQHRLVKAEAFTEDRLKNPNRYRVRTLPAAGAMPLPEDVAEQLSWED